MELTKEQLEKAKQIKSPKELLAFAEENGIELTEENVKQGFAQLHKEGEVTDEELDNVSGGSCSDDFDTWWKVTKGDCSVMYCKNCDYETIWDGEYLKWECGYESTCPQCGATRLYFRSYVRPLI